jgi:hypothetical protein
MLLYSEDGCTLDVPDLRVVILICDGLSGKYICTLTRHDKAQGMKGKTRPCVPLQMLSKFLLVVQWPKERATEIAIACVDPTFHLSASHHIGLLDTIPHTEIPYRVLWQ